MKGLDLAERYFLEYGVPLIEAGYPEYQQRIAAGLVGPGSECLGFDDELSRDHDWGPSFCLWLTKPDYNAIGEKLQSDLGQLPKEYEGFPARMESTWGSGRTGVFEIGAFYRQFIGLEEAPTMYRQWLTIPEDFLATATSGRVFVDPLGEFTAIRESLLKIYPEDIRLKKIASRCMTIAQSGQYNYPRCIRRGELVAARMAESHFIGDAISLAFLLNRRYKPFYKWMHRALRDLPILGLTLHTLFRDMVICEEGEQPGARHDRRVGLIEEICGHLIGELRRQGLSDSSSSFLLDHGPMVQTRIKDPTIRGLNVWTE